MLNLFTRRPSTALDLAPAEPVEVTPIERRTRPSRPAPDMLTVRRTAFDLAAKNLCYTPANRGLGSYDRQRNLRPDAEVIAAWLAEAPDLDDYDTRVQALKLLIQTGGVAERSYHGTRTVVVRSGEGLRDKAKDTYKRILGE